MNTLLFPQDFIEVSEKQNVLTLKKHLHHGTFNIFTFISSPPTVQLFFVKYRFVEIWKNTPIMSTHILSMILQHRINQEITLTVCQNLMDEFDKEFRPHHDLAFVGDMENITQYSLKVLSRKGTTPTSVAVDILKLESLMSKHAVI